MRDRRRFRLKRRGHGGLRLFLDQWCEAARTLRQRRRCGVRPFHIRFRFGRRRRRYRSPRLDGRSRRHLRPIFHRWRSRARRLHFLLRLDRSRCHHAPRLGGSRRRRLGRLFYRRRRNKAPGPRIAFPLHGSSRCVAPGFDSRRGWLLRSRFYRSGSNKPRWREVRFLLARGGAFRLAAKQRCAIAQPFPERRNDGTRRLYFVA